MCNIVTYVICTQPILAHRAHHGSNHVLQHAHRVCRLCSSMASQRADYLQGLSDDFWKSREGDSPQWRYARRGSHTPTLVYEAGRDGVRADRGGRCAGRIWLANVDCTLEPTWLRLIEAPPLLPHCVPLLQSRLCYQGGRQGDPRSDLSVIPRAIPQVTWK